MSGLPPLLVLAVGNPSRGDDALGPLLLEKLSGWLGDQNIAGIELIEDFQLQVEHALDLEGRQLALFIDAGQATPAPYTFSALEPTGDFGHSTHALEPGAILRVFRQTLGDDPPPAFLLCIAGQSFELGESLSRAAEEHLDAAFVLLCQLLANPDADFWYRQTGNC